jgi:flagellar biosynthetic protein FliQ
MERVALSLFVAALKSAAVLSLPVVCVVAAVGIMVGVVQTVVSVQDQNVSFAPKLAAVALLIAAGGPPAFTILRNLLATAIAALPHIARA